jgi:competence protein ComEA
VLRIGRLLAWFVLLVSPAVAEPGPLERIAGCTFVPADWADGDSFQVRKPDGTLLTVRLYGVDCLEWHIGDDTDARRLRAQRRYFGITGAAGGPAGSIDLATGFGRQAAEHTARLLQRPFTLHTRMQKALGDGRHLRFYAFVETADGKDLAAELVRAGLARAYGVSAEGPGGRSAARYKEILADLELQAAKRGAGIWARTDWDKLPAEREIQRGEDEEDRIAQGEAALPAGFRLDPNTAARDDLERLPGIGETLANRIIEAREDAPFARPDDLLRVPGIKRKTLERIRPYLAFHAP